MFLCRAWTAAATEALACRRLLNMSHAASASPAAPAAVAKRMFSVETRTRPLRISVEGNIATGKSTFLRLLEEHVQGQLS